MTDTTVRASLPQKEKPSELCQIAQYLACHAQLVNLNPGHIRMRPLRDAAGRR